MRNQAGLFLIITCLVFFAARPGFATNPGVACTAAQADSWRNSASDPNTRIHCDGSRWRIIEKIDETGAATSRVKEVVTIGGETLACSADLEGTVRYNWPPSSLVGRWRMDESSGTTLDDAISTNDGTMVSAPIWRTTSGRIGGTLEFDGADDAATITNAAALTSASGTWAFWVRTAGAWGTDGGDTSNTAIMLSRHGATSSLNGLFIGLQPSPAVNVGFEAKNGTTTVCGTSATTTTITDNAWHHIALVFNQASGSTITLFIDGAQVAQCTNSAAWNFSTNGFRLADSPDTFWEEFGGQIDDLRIYNVALTATEIAAIINPFQFCNGTAWTPFRTTGVACSNDFTSQCILNATRSTSDAQFIASSISSGVNVLGVTGSYTPPSVGWGGNQNGAIASGNGFSCGIRADGPANCWGGDGNGQVGNGGTTGDQTAPVVVNGSFTDWTALGVGDTHSCGVRANGTLYCWGDDVSGQVGNGATTGNQTAPVLVNGGFTDWVNVAAGSSNSCGIRRNGTVYCWGSDGNGQVGNGATTGTQTAPVLVNGGFTDWVLVSTGDIHSCGIRRNGTVYCWGGDTNGQVGNGATTGDQTAPVLVNGGFTDWSALSAGDTHNCGIRRNGTLYCWGSDASGQVGNGGTTGDQFAPVLVNGGFTDWVQVAGGVAHICGLRANGTIYCWGANLYGQLGNGNNTDQNAPVLVSGGFTDWATVIAGPSGHTTCGVRTNGNMYCWGYDLYGMLGNGAPSSDSNVPVQVN